MRILFLVLLMITFLSCHKPINHKKIYSFTFFEMDTQLTISYVAEKKDRALEKKIIEYVKTFDAENSFYKEQSFLAKMNASEKSEFEVSYEFCDIMSLSKKFFIESESRFNIAYKSPIAFKAMNQFEAKCNPKAKSSIQVLAKGGLYDTGGIAKGYVIDRTGDLLKKYHSNFMVNYGGDMLICGAKPDKSNWRIGIKNPYDPSKLLKIIERNKKTCYAIATSGDYERYIVKEGKKHSHIVNPKTGKSIHGAHSITVLAKNATTADVLATAISVGHKDENYMKRMKKKFALEVFLLTGKDLNLRELQ